MSKYKTIVKSASHFANSRISKTVCKIASKHGSKILTGLGISGFITSIIWSGKIAPKTKEEIDSVKEEFNVDVKILGYLGSDEKETTVGHFFHAEIIDGIPTLGGEENDRNNPDNYYEIRRINIDKINEIDIDAKEFINKARNNEYVEVDNVKNR